MAAQDLFVVGIGDYAISSDSAMTIATYGLGPCLGVAIYDESSLLAGLGHFQLPLSLVHPNQDQMAPKRFVDTGLNLLIGDLILRGAELNRMRITVAGGASSPNTPVRASMAGPIGVLNCKVFEKWMRKNGVQRWVADVGGDRPRTISIRVRDGHVDIRNSGSALTLLDSHPLPSFGKAGRA